MAFPTVSATNTTIDDDGDGTAVINLPASIAASDLLLIIKACALAFNSSHSAPAGWTQLFNSAPGNQRLSGFYKVASGSEGSTVNITNGTNGAIRAVTYRIAAGSYNGVPVAGTVAGNGGASNFTAANPPSLTSGFGLIDTLWIACEADNGGSPATNPSALPTNYGNLVEADDSGFRLATARRELNAASDDPSAFTVPSSEWTTQTIAISGKAGSRPIFRRPHLILPRRYAA